MSDEPEEVVFNEDNAKPCKALGGSFFGKCPVCGLWNDDKEECRQLTNTTNKE